MLIIILAGVFVGFKLDQIYPNQYKAFTILFSFESDWRQSVLLFHLDSGINTLEIIYEKVDVGYLGSTAFLGAVILFVVKESLEWRRRRYSRKRRLVGVSEAVLRELRSNHRSLVEYIFAIDTLFFEYFESMRLD